MSLSDDLHAVDQYAASKLKQAELDVLASLNAVPYAWDLENDEISWGGDIQALLNKTDGHLNSGHHFSALLSEDSRANFQRLRNSVVSGHGLVFTPYTHVYCVMPSGKQNSRRMWVEAVGRCFRDENGRPVLAKGIMRVLYSNAPKASGSLQANDIQEHFVGPLGRNMFVELLSDSLEEAKSSNKPIAMVLATINNLNEINASYGFDVADEVIEHTMLKLRGIMRKRDYIGRVSGAKMAMVMHNCDDKSARIACTRFMEILKQELYAINGEPISTSICFGAVVVPENAQTIQEALDHAKEALEEAKLTINKGYYCYASSSERVLSLQKYKETSDILVAALNDRRVELAFQPVRDAKTGKVWFYEALVRLREKDTNLLGASAFVPAAEQLGLMTVIDHRVLELALETLTQYPDITLSVNITPGTVHSDEWIATLKAAHRRDGEILKRLIIELTESAVVDNIEWCRDFLVEIKKLGCKAAIDDFGAGYSSFRYLRAFDVDIVKIDGAYIMNLSNSADDQAFVKTMITLAKSLDLVTIAEWVVNEEDAAILQQWGINGLQGEYVGMPVSSIEQLLQPIAPEPVDSKPVLRLLSSAGL